MPAFRTAAFCLCLFSFTTASAQRLDPMTDSGVTFTDTRAVILTVTNPYRQAERFRLEAFDPDLVTPARNVRINPDAVTLGSGSSRRVVALFQVPEGEREIAICMQLEVSEDAQIVPRVCGRYVGRRVGAQ